MKNKDRIFNTFGYSLEELESMNGNSDDIKLKEVCKEIASWRFIEKVEYFEELKELYGFIEKKKLNIFSKEQKQKIVGEIMKFLKTDSLRLAEDILWVMKKEIESGGLKDLKK